MSPVFSSPPVLKIVCKEHFWVSGLKRAFEITGVVPLYVFVRDNYEKLPKEKDLEFTIGSSTIVYQVKNQEIQLITGWIGSRK
ncbi:hypothetical protein N3114_05420 [Aliarcobacter butzleri]|uniref:hypothetical protein n=1 Tax=Aliarcobacter butzleri TaxID=28197 RepID=UPI0021B47A07|nr:hypothetical protein [Aliarcobacter butzleri]UXC30457.1 hypothetical protein N3114_05420 [Aliarcobacter butzleri]